MQESGILRDSGWSLWWNALPSYLIWSYSPSNIGCTRISWWCHEWAQDKPIHVVSDEATLWCLEDSLHVLVVRFYHSVCVLLNVRKMPVICKSHIYFWHPLLLNVGSERFHPNTIVLIFWKHCVAHYETIFVGFLNSSRYISAPNSCNAHARVNIPLIFEHAFFYQARHTC